LPDANIDNVKQRLTQVGLVPRLRGDIITVPVSAHRRRNRQAARDDLLQADVMELKAIRHGPRAARLSSHSSIADAARSPPC